MISKGEWNEKKEIEILLLSIKRIKLDRQTTGLSFYERKLRHFLFSVEFKIFIELLAQLLLNSNGQLASNVAVI
jgi:hypothetical protein